MENPSLEELLALEGIEWIDLASHLGKQQILDEIIVNLIYNSY